MTRPEPTRPRSTRPHLTQSQADQPHDLSEAQGIEDLVVLTLPYCKCHSGDDLVLARQVGDDTYRIVEVPPKPSKIGLGDLVIAVPFGDLLEYVTVIERRCLTACEFAVPQWVDREQFVVLLAATGVAHREVAPGSYICNAESESVVLALCELLGRFDIRSRLFDHDTQEFTDL